MAESGAELRALAFAQLASDLAQTYHARESGGELYDWSKEGHSTPDWRTCVGGVCLQTRTRVAAILSRKEAPRD